MKTQHLTKIALSILIVAILTVMTVGEVRASVGLVCNEKGDGIIITLHDFTPWKNQTVPITANGAGVGQMTFDAQGNGTATIPAQSGVTYNIGLGGKSIGAIKCEPKGPSGNQGQTTPGNSTTVVNGSQTYGTVGDPISTSSGEYFFTLPLLNLGGFIPVQFSLRYASQMDKSTADANDPFGGDHFTHNFHAAIKMAGSDSLTVFLGGELIAFKKIDGKWKIEKEETVYQLQETGVYFFLLDPILQRVYTFTRVGNNAWLTRIEDHNGNALTITNDGAGRVLRVDDGLGRFLVFTYASPGGSWTWPHLAQVTDQANRTIKFGYTSTLTGALTTHLTNITDPLGGVTKFTYAGTATNGVVSAVTHPLGNTPYTQKYESLANGGWRVTEQKDALGNVTKLSFSDTNAALIDPLGIKTTQAHKDKRYLDTMTDAAGKAASLRYDDSGRRIMIKDRLGGSTQIAYHAATGNIASMTNAKGETVTYTYVEQPQFVGAQFTFYNLSKVDYADKTSEQFTYDTRGNVTAITNRDGKTWKFTHSFRGQVLTQTNPLGGVTTYAYNNDGTTASVQDAETGVTTFTYDALKRVTKVANPDKSQMQIAYDAADRMTLLTDENGRVTKYEYDANGNPIKITDAGGKTITIEYDTMDRAIKINDRAGGTSTLSYDALGRVASAIDATGVKTEYGYDARGWVNQIALGDSVWKLDYDDEGVVTSITSPSGSVTKFQNDNLGLPATITDALGNTRANKRDSLNRITAITDPLKRETLYGYDARGLLTSAALPVVGEAKYEYDALGNLMKIMDLNGQAWTFTYSSLGRLLSQADPLKRPTKFEYDANGKLTTVTHADTATQKFTYDASGNVISVKHPDGLEFKYVYDALERLTESNGIKLSYDAEGRVVTTENGGGQFGATYDNAGRLKTVAYGNVVVTYSYDPKTGLLASVSDSLTKAQINFAYDKDLRLVGITRSNKVNTTYTRDRAGRLTRLQDGNMIDAQYTLDAAGQVTNIKMNLPLDPSSELQPLTTQFQYDAASQNTSSGYKYDARGRLIESPGGAFKWNSASQLIGMDQTALTYNGLGDITSRGATQFAYNYALGLAPIVAETTDPKGFANPSNVTRYYVWSPGGELLYAIENDKPLFYHFDRTGSTLALTDDSGKMTDAYAYDPYGKMLKHDGKSVQPFTFTGKWGVRQENATLYHARARYYDSTTARFLSPDPTGIGIQNALHLNPYTYSYNDPINYADVDGADGFSLGDSFGDLLSPPSPSKAISEMNPLEQAGHGLWDFKKDGSFRFGDPNPHLNIDNAKLQVDKAFARLDYAPPKPIPEVPYQGKGFVEGSKLGSWGKSGLNAGGKVVQFAAEGGGVPLAAIELYVRGNLWTLDQWRYMAREKAAKQAEYERRKAEYEAWKADQEWFKRIDLAKRESEFELWKIQQKEQARVDAILRNAAFLGGGAPGDGFNTARETVRKMSPSAVAEQKMKEYFNQGLKLGR